MLTLACMLLIVAFLGFIVIFIDRKGNTGSFFDLENTNCMRGFWCLVVLLVHIPVEYENSLQSMIGSFAYIGVTFFFMTSSYGLMLGAAKDIQKVKKEFWKRRLAKLLLPMFLVNLARVAAEAVCLKSFTWWKFFAITGFVRQILFFYFIFWIVVCILPEKISFDVKCVILCLAVLLFSIIIYLWKTNGVFSWPVESFGFAYGVLLARKKEIFLKLSKKKSWIFAGLFMGLSLVLGFAYLKFKSIVFFGDYIVKAVLGIAILGFILLLNTRISIGNCVSRFLGKISYEVYLIHDVVFIILAAIPLVWNSGVFVLCSIIITVILSFAVNKFSNLILSIPKKVMKREKKCLKS